MSKKFTDVIKKSIRLYSAALAPSKYKLVGQERNYYRTRWNKGATSIPLYLTYKTLLRENNTQALKDLLNGPDKEPSDDNGNARIYLWKMRTRYLIVSILFTVYPQSLQKISIKWSAPTL